jgi:hypothetical protein
VNFARVFFVEKKLREIKRLNHVHAYRILSNFCATLAARCALCHRAT